MLRAGVAVKIGVFRRGQVEGSRRGGWVAFVDVVVLWRISWVVLCPDSQEGILTYERAVVGISINVSPTSSPLYQDWCVRVDYLIECMSLYVN